VLKEELNRYGIAIAAVQEIRWSEGEIFDSGDFIVCYSRNEEEAIWDIISNKQKI
jgi:hypothetical protein